MSLKRKKIIAYITGLFILSFGVSLCKIAGLGIASWDALSIGLYTRFGITVGTWYFIVGCITIIVNAIIGRTRPEILGMVTVTLFGYFMDFWILVIFKNISISWAVFQFLLLFLGIIFMGLGVSLYLHANFALIPLDRFMLNLQKIFHLPLMAAKLLTELIAFISTLIVKGPIGIGTIILLIAIGPSIQFFHPKWSRFFEQK